MSEPPGSAGRQVGVTVQAVQSDDMCAYNVGLELVQVAQLTRPPGPRIFAVTWSTGRLCVAATEDLKKAVVGDSRHYVRRFPQDLTAAQAASPNAPKRPGA